MKCEECLIEPWTHVFTDKRGRRRYLCGDCYVQAVAPLPPLPQKGKPGDMTAPRPPTPLKGDHGWPV